jgi:hypothetical protein
MKRIVIILALVFFASIAIAAEPVKPIIPPPVIPQPAMTTGVTSTAPAFPPLSASSTLALPAVPTIDKLTTTVTSTVPDPENDFAGFAKLFKEAAKNGNWKLLAVLLVIGIVWALRKYGVLIPKVGDFLKSARGGAILTILTGVFGVIAAGLVSSGKFSAGLIWDGILLGLTAAGGWTIVKKLLGDDLWAKLGGEKEKVK